MARIKKGDLVEVVRGRTSDPKKLAERNARRADEGLDPLQPGDKGKRGRVLRVFPAEDKVLVEGVNLRTRHVRQNAQGQSGAQAAGGASPQDPSASAVSGGGGYGTAGSGGS